MVYAQAFYRFHLWDVGTFPQLVLLGSAFTAGMTWLVGRRAEDGLTVLWLLLAGFVGISLGVIIDVAVSPIAETGGERNLFPFEIVLLTLFGLPGAIAGSVLGWTTRRRGPQQHAA